MRFLQINSFIQRSKNIKMGVGLIRMFNMEVKGVHQAALLLSISSILSKMLALMRDRLLAVNFGAGAELDVYFAAFRIPDFVFTLTIFMTAGASIMPIFIKEASQGKERANVFLGGLVVFFIIFIMIFLGLAFFIAPILSKSIAPGFNDKQLANLTLLTRIMLLSPLFLGLSNIISIAIQASQKFFIYALSPLIYNGSIIIGILFFYPLFGFKGLAFGVVLGALLHFLIQMPSLISLGFVPKLNFKLTRILKEAYYISFYRTLGLSFNQIVLILLTSIASTLGSGGVSVFNLANNLQSIPLSVVGISYSIAALPFLSKFFVNNHQKEFLSHVSLAVRHIIFWSFPFSILFIVFRAQIVRVLLGAGMFNWNDTRLTAASLALFSISITAQSLIVILSRAYYAAEKTLKPLLINALSSSFIIFISLTLIAFLKRYDVLKEFFGRILRVDSINNIEILVLSLSFSLGSIINAWLLWKYFVKDFGNFEEGILRTVRDIGAGGLVLGFFSYFGLRLFSFVFNTHTFLGIFLQGLLSFILGTAAAVLLLLFLNNKEFQEISSSLKTKFSKHIILKEGTETIT